jgi:hypothetical protein
MSVKLGRTAPLDYMVDSNGQFDSSGSLYPEVHSLATATRSNVNPRDDQNSGRRKCTKFELGPVLLRIPILLEKGYSYRLRLKNSAIYKEWGVYLKRG